MKTDVCPLCSTDGGLLVFKSQQFCVIHVAEAGFPAFYRGVWNSHLPEFSSLSSDDRSICMSAVVAVEQVLREQLRPTKINLAALGNVVPHLHCHVIARFDWDSHFPVLCGKHPKMRRRLKIGAASLPMRTGQSPEG